MISLPAFLMTVGWVLLVGLILIAFGRAAGGAWSIAGTVARGVRDWASPHRSGPAPSSSPSGAAGTADVEEL